MLIRWLLRNHEHNVWRNSYGVEPGPVQATASTAVLNVAPAQDLATDHGDGLRLPILLARDLRLHHPIHGYLQPVEMFF
jgi:hypothetical protein